MYSNDLCEPCPHSKDCSGLVKCINCNAMICQLSGKMCDYCENHLVETRETALFQLQAIRAIFAYMAEENHCLAGDFSIMFQEITRLIEKIENVKEDN